jgi:phenol 2-monooxygenase
MAKHSHTDLLIIGAGPAGLMAAAWASQYGVTTRFIDDKPGKVETGHADGLTCRTLEILDSFGMADKVLKEASFDVEMRSWVSPQSNLVYDLFSKRVVQTEDSSGTMHRSQTVLSQKPGLSRFWQCTLNQGRLEAIFLDLLERAAQVSVERNTKTIELITDPGPDERSKYHPISLRVHNPTTSLSSGSSLGDIEEIHAKYVIACDGAHSWTRAQRGIYLEGQQTDGVWGVMDVIPLTDFRKSSQIVFGMLYSFIL